MNVSMSKALASIGLVVGLIISLTASAALADDWFVKKFGKNDELGHANYLTAKKAKQAANQSPKHG